MSNIKLSSPKLRVILGNPDDPNSWVEHEVQTIGRDSIQAETLGGVNKWGRATEHAMRYLSGIAYFALMRRGIITGPYEDFENAYIEIQPVSVDDAFPTVTGPDPD